MSQLERALRKARAEESEPETGGAARPLANAAFVPAWSFDDAADRVAARPPHIEPVAAPPPAVAQPHVRHAADVRKPAVVAQFRGFSPDIQSKLVVGSEAPPDLREQFGKIAAV